jgi:hypothetical protein|tara:strand:- start:2546 stop:2848 length:303 start_codon:yes stop_codon:yes gene_type:complete
MADIHRRSKKQEERSAETYKGSRNVMSGAGWVRKNDIRAEDLLIENKFTDKKAYSIKSEEMVKLARTAILEDRVPVLQVDLGGRSYVVLLEDDFLEMLNA